MSDWEVAENFLPPNYKPVHAVNVHTKCEALMIFDGVEWHELERDHMVRGIGFYPTHWRHLPTFPQSNDLGEEH